MDEKIDEEKNTDELLLPGFRFHPTDEELVEFYLKRKVQHRPPLLVELIKQVDIYKYDPWDLPKMASSCGEKEWYFYCLRDRKYKNSLRPNRVTGSGFWKATGTDRPIYSSCGAKCVGFKKSLVFYRGRAAKGMKTDWMMHEFRLPSTTTAGGAPPAKVILDNNIPTSDSWAICRIFKKANSMAHRALSQPWLTSLYETIHPDAFTYSANDARFNSAPENPLQQANISVVTTGKPYVFTSTGVDYFTGNHHFWPPEDVPGETNKSTINILSAALDGGPSKTSDSIIVDLDGPEQLFNGFSADSLREIINVDDEEEELISKNQTATDFDNSWGNNIHSSMGFPFSLPSAEPDQFWKPPDDLPWGSSPPCPSEISSRTCSTTSFVQKS